MAGKTLSQCLSGEQWYKCPLPLTIFCIFFLLFVYAIYILIVCSQLIKEQSDIGDIAFYEKYKKNLHDITRLYVVNMVVLILSVLIVSFFLYKTLPPEQQAGLFNEYLGGFIVLFIFIVSCWTLSVFSSMHNHPNAPVGASSAVLVLSIIAIGIYMYRIYESYKSKQPRKPATAS